MRQSRGSFQFLLLSAALVVLVSGCATPTYSPTRYQAAQNRFGPITLTTAKKVYVCPFIDHLNSKNRSLLNAKFVPYEYLTDAMEQELTASGISSARVPFEFGPSFASAQETIKEKANKDESAVYIASDVVWLNQGKLTLDTKVYSPSGEALFEKRGLCCVLGSSVVDSQKITHMALRQILADPDFQKALR